MQELLSTGQAGFILQMTSQSVRRAVQSGRLRAAATTPSGQYLLERGDIEAFRAWRAERQQRMRDDAPPMAAAVESAVA